MLFCKKNQISQYENNVVEPKISVAVKMAECLGSSVGYLINGEVGVELGEEEKEMVRIMQGMDKSAKKMMIGQMKVFQ